jgi:ATP-binding cassette subfamily B protein
MTDGKGNAGDGNRGNVAGGNGNEVNKTNKGGVHAIVMREEDKKPVSRQTVFWLLSYALRYKFRLAGAILLLMTAVGLELLGPVINKTIIDNHLIHVGTRPVEYGPVLSIISLYVGVLVIAALCNYAQSILLQTTALRIVFNMRMDLMRHLQRLAVRFFDNTPVGTLVNRISNDTESIRDLYLSFMATFTVSLMQVIGIYTYLFVLDAAMAKYVLLLLPLYATVMWLLLRYGNRYLSAMRARISDMNTMLSESILVMPVLQLFRREKETIREFEQLNRDWQTNHFKQLRLNSLITRNLLSLSASLMMAWILWSYGIVSLETGLTIGMMTAFLDYIGRLYNPVIAVFDQLVNAQRALVAAERVRDILEEPADERQADAFGAPVGGLAEAPGERTEVPRHGARTEARGERRIEPANEPVNEPRNAALAETAAGRQPAESGEGHPGERIEPAVPAPPRKTGHVRFENVWFAYNGQEYVLKDINFEARPGETVALVGHTGSGKSSIMNLLLGFYDATSGTITVDGTDIRTLSKRELRKDMAVVLQDPFLFAGDIRFNVSLYTPGIDTGDVERALAAVGADVFVDRLPRGIHEPVVERGSTLSAGQRQLITFARALAHDPAILILDEATASIDSETESLIQHALQVVSRGRTTFVIAHRLSTIRDADQILVLHRGEIVERGTHDELMRLQGRYYRMYQLQKGEVLVS